MPTSLTYINLSARGCSPRRPDADMGTNQCEGAQLSPWIFKFQTGAARTSQETRRSFGLRPSLRATRFTRPFIPLTRKDNSSRPSGRILQVGSCLTTRRQRMPQQPPRLSSGMSTGLPFTGPRRASSLCMADVSRGGFRLWFRIDSPMYKCCSHGTLLHLSP